MAWAMRASIVFAGLMWVAAHAVAGQALHVFAPASLKDALDDVLRSPAVRGSHRVVVVHAASSVLVRQIDNGAPADLLITADEAWMEHALNRGLVGAATRRGLVTNRLVLIAPSGAKMVLAIERDMPLARVLGHGRLAVGDPAHVPVGRYARAALTNLGVWPSVERKLAPTENVRVALALVARGEAPLGIVYQTDAQGQPAVEVVGVFPEATHPPVIYQVAITQSTRARSAALGLLDRIRSDEASKIFVRYGFGVPR